ncbi:glutamate racemase [Thermodesulfobacteriota bacterium]
MKQEAIGIFDSGIGGLTVLKEVRRKLPHENILYLGDTARVPYGIRSSQTVLKYSIANTDFLLKQNIKLLVIACNTASAVATDTLCDKYDIPIIDVVGPGSRGAVRTTKNKKVGIIGTEGTIRSSAYQKAIHSLQQDIETFTQPCPLFVNLAEEGWCGHDDEVVLLIAKRYLAGLKSLDIDTLVLGCTHYPLLKGALRSVMGESIALIDSAEETAQDVADLLQKQNLMNERRDYGSCRFFLTDIPHRFTETGKLFLGEELRDVEVVDI